MSTQRAVVVGGIGAALGLGVALWAASVGLVTVVKAVGLCGLWFDIIGALVLGIGLIFPPSEMSSTYEGTMPELEVWFAEGKRDATIGLTLIVVGFIGQFVSGFFS